MYLLAPDPDPSPLNPPSKHQQKRTATIQTTTKTTNKKQQHTKQTPNKKQNINKYNQNNSISLKTKQNL